MSETEVQAEVATARLGDLLAGVQAGFASGERAEKGVIQLRMNNVDTQGRFVWDRFLRVPASPDMIDEYRLRRGDVVFNNTNSTELVGKSALFVDHAEPVVYSNHFTRLRVRPDALSPAYLSAWLNHQWQSGTFAELCNRWIGQSAVKADKLLALSIPLPPLAEQERIAGRLTEQLAAVERARGAAQSRLAAAESLTAAYLREVYEVPEARGWERPTIDDIAEVQGGYAFKSDWFTEGGVRVLRNANIHQGFIEWDDVVFVSADHARELPSLVLAEGDIVLTLDRPIVAGGLKAARLGADDLPAVLNQRVARFNLDANRIDADYFYTFLRSKAFIGGLPKHDHSLGVPHVSPGQVGEIAVPLPPLPDQRRIAADLAARLAGAERLAEGLRAELAAIEALPAALLREAFGGTANQGD